MTKLLTFTCTLLLFFTLSASAQSNFGKAVDKTNLTPISDLLTTPNKYLGKEVTVSGTIVSVCAKRGCWMTFASDKKYQNLRVKVKDGQMVFPLSAKGKKGYATGILTKRGGCKGNHKKEAKHREHSLKKISYQLIPTGVTIE